MGRQTWGGIAGGPCRTIEIVVLGVRLGERPAPSGTTMNTAGAASIKPMFRLTSLLKVKSARGMGIGAHSRRRRSLARRRADIAARRALVNEGLRTVGDEFVRHRTALCSQDRLDPVDPAIHCGEIAACKGRSVPAH